MSEKGKDEVKEPRKGMSVYTIKQALSRQGKFSKSGAVVVREKATITNLSADQMNEAFDAGMNGRFCELNKEEDTKFQKALKEAKK